MPSWEPEDPAHSLELWDLGLETIQRLFCTYRPVPEMLRGKKTQPPPGNYPELFSLRETNEALINFLSNTAN